MEYLIELSQGNYYQQRGGFDWGRSGPGEATVFDTVEEAEAEIDSRRLRTFGGRPVLADISE